MNTDADQAFLSLLSSQRELLNRLNMESSAKASQEPGDKARGKSSKHNRLVNTCTNHSIAERRPSMDIVMSKRFSIGFGCDPFAFSMMDARSELVPSSWKDDGMDLLGDKRLKDEPFGNDDMKRRKKRRMSSLGFLSPMIFEENLEDDCKDLITFGPDENDPSIKTDEDSTLENTPSKVVSQDGDDESEGTKGEGKKGEEDKDQAEDDEDEDDDDASVGSISVEPFEFQPSKVDPTKFRETMEAFHKSMEMSQNSQQAIHDWDRKMGLKRSHSKTMRLSSRSRKKLKAIMKKEIGLMTIKC